MNWIALTDAEQLTALIKHSSQKPQVIFKHSTRCSISSMAKARLERSPTPDGVDFHYLDLLQYRQISNSIAAQFDVLHESPQVLLLIKGECVYAESQTGISMEDLLEHINSK